MSYRLLTVVVAIAVCSAAVVWWSNGSDERSGGDGPDGSSSSAPESPQREKLESKQGPVWFRDVSSRTGIRFVHDSGTSSEKPFPAANGSGLGIIDFDCDGLPDLCFLSGTDFPVDLSAGPETVALYRNGDDWKFDDVTSVSGISHRGYSAGLAVGDFDSDGFPDLYINCYGANVLLRNAGDGTFERVSDDSGAADSRWGTSAAFLDFDNDGLQDIYVCNYAEWSLEENDFCGDRSRGIRVYCSPRSVKAVPDALYRNQGDGRFEDAFAGKSPDEISGRAQGVVASDLNNDGLVDLYIGNDLHANSLLFNSENGFEDVSELTGAAYDHFGAMQAGMGVTSADVNRDGWFDLLVTNFENEHNAFYENVDGTLFQEVAHSRQLASAGLPWVGWGTAFADFDLDGWCDLVVTNGHVDDNRHLMGQSSKYEAPALLWKNTKGRFELVGEEAGEYFAEQFCGRALAVGDLDRDGDDDLVIGHQDSAPALLANQAVSDGDADSRGSVQVRLIGTAGNRDAVGTRLVVRVEGEELPRHYQITGGGSYLSVSEHLITIAMADRQSVAVEVHWPSGHQQHVAGLVSPGRFVIVESPGDRETVATRVPWQ